MNKQDHINYWQTSAESDWAACEVLFEKEKNLQSLFFAHLVLEKLLKAHWVKDNSSDYPPKIHNLEFLFQQTDLELSLEEELILDKMGVFQMHTRYPDFQFKINKLCTQPFTQELLGKVATLRNSLLNKLL